MNTIKELYYGNNASYDNIKLSKEWHKMIPKINKANEKLVLTLGDEQKELLEQLRETMVEQFTIEKADTYEQALALGIGLGYESKRITEVDR